MSSFTPLPDKDNCPDLRPPSADDRWFSENVRPHEPALRRWLQARFPTVRDVDDVVQESFVRALRASRTDVIANVRAFLFTTARNFVLNELRHRRHEQPAGLGEGDSSSVLDESANTAEAVARRQEVELLHQALQSLPDCCRRVFMLRRLQGVPQREIAARLGISEKTVENQSVIALNKCVEFFARHADRPVRARLVRPEASERRFVPGEVRHA